MSGRDVRPARSGRMLADGTGCTADQYRHDWQRSEHTSPSGKLMYHCPMCGLYDPAPVKPEYESRPCAPGRYERCREVRDGKVYTTMQPPKDGERP